MPSCTVRNVSLNYLDAGTKSHSQPPFVLIHGAGGNSSRWQEQLEPLGETSYTIALDLPGHGASEGSPCDQIFLYREWLWEFINTMELEEVVVAGHSMGGAIALDFALKYPRQTRGLILVGTAARFEPDPDRMEALRQGEYRPEWVREGFSAYTSQEIIDQFIQEGMTQDPKVLYIDMLACSRFNCSREKLQSIETPAVIICGTEDVATPPKSSRRLDKHLPYSSLSLIEKAAHQVMLEQPESVNKAIFDFMSF